MSYYVMYVRATSSSLASHSLWRLESAAAMPPNLVAAPASASSSVTLPKTITLRDRVQAARGGILDLADVHLGASDAVELCQLMRQKPTIQSIVLHANELGDAGASAIAPLISAGSLKSLNLYGNAIGHAGAQSICSALQCNTSTLHALSLQLNPLGLEACKYFASSLTSTSSLRILNLGACLLGDAGCQALFASSVLLQTLHALHLESNDLTSAGALHIGKALQSAGRSCSLQRLFLSDNPRLGVDPAGVQALAAGLVSSTSLVAIELESCGIESDGATALFQAALPLPSEHTSALQVLVLAHNPIGDAALLECARRLRQLARPDTAETAAPASSALSWLDLADTGLTDKSAVAIADAIRGNPNALRILFLGYTFAVRLSASAASSLAKALAVNTLLTYFQGPGEPLLSPEWRQQNRARLLELTSKL